MAQERRRAGARPVSPGTEHRDQIADLGTGHEGIVGKPVKRRAKTADNVHFFCRLCIVTACNR
jgi:hypothetical protein